MTTTTEFVYDITDDQFDTYHEMGYLVVGGLLSEAECDHILSIMRRHANADFAAILNADTPEFLKNQDPHCSEEKIAETTEIVRDLMKDARIVSVLDRLQGREVVGLMCQMLFKEATTIYAKQAWRPHQDNNYARSPNKQYITTNLFLEDADVDNGTMYIFPGSHKEDLLPARPHVSYREGKGENPGNEVEVPEQYEKVDLVVQKGDFLVLNGNVIHGSYANTSSTRSRPLFSFSYITEGEEFIAGKTAQRTVISLR